MALRRGSGLIMSVPKPVGPHSQEMLASGGWPELDEDALSARAGELTDVLRQVTSVSEAWMHQQPHLFSPVTWSGSASTAAAAKVSGVIASLHEQQMSLATAILWYQSVYSTVAATKTGISEVVNLAHWLIAEIEATAAINPQAASQVQEVINAARELNVGAVTQAASAAAVSGFNPPLTELTQLVNQAGLPTLPVPNAAPPALSAPMTAVPGGIPASTPPGIGGPPHAPPAASTSGAGASNQLSPNGLPAPSAGPANGQNVPSGNSVSSSPNSAAAGADGTSAPPGLGGPPPGGAPAASSVPGAPSTAGLGPGASGSVPPMPAATSSAVSDSSSAAGSASAGGSGAAGSSPAAGASTSSSPLGEQHSPDRADDGSRTTQGAVGGPPVGSISPAAHAAAPAAASVAPRQQVAPPAVPPRSGATGPAGGPGSSGSGTARVTPAAASGPAGVQGRAAVQGRAVAGSWPGAGPSRAAGGAVPLGSTPTPAPGAVGKPLADPPSNPTTAGAIVPVPLPPTPVDRQAAPRPISAADPVASAIRIAAALNADDRPEKTSPGFFWATAVTIDGQIIVSNSYGLGYIPSAQTLPEQILLVTLDHTIPLAERVSWVSWPWRALAAWAQAKKVGLRTVIGTEEQLREIDVGAPHRILADDETPATSEVAGRDRLAVIAPARAEQLADTPDAKLIGLLPPPPADDVPPTNRSAELWSAVSAPMISNGFGREIPQLQALLTYADHCEELAIHRAYAAVDPAIQRAAIADGLYWHHLAALTDSALTISR